MKAITFIIAVITVCFGVIQKKIHLLLKIRPLLK
jgi:hypothetical protein